MLRGRPSGLSPQRSMAMAWLTPATRHAAATRKSPGVSSTPTSSTATPTPVSCTAARTASAQGESTAMRTGTPQAPSAAASSAVPTGPSVSGAATPSRGTKKPVIRPMLVACTSERAAAASSPRLASISAWVPRPTSRQTSASIASSALLFGGDIDSVPVCRRIVDHPVDPPAHHLVVALPPGQHMGRFSALLEDRQGFGEAAGAIEREERRLAVGQRPELRPLGLRRVADQGVDTLRLGLALHHDEVELERREIGRPLPGVLADDAAGDVGPPQTRETRR